MDGLKIWPAIWRKFSTTMSYLLFVLTGDQPQGIDWARTAAEDGRGSPCLRFRILYDKPEGEALREFVHIAVRITY
jgi:hypothetical protein